jgi:hypothetical protein
VLSARVNLLTETEFRNGITDAPTRGGLVTASTLSGYAGAIAFGHDGTTAAFAYKGGAATSNVTQRFSVVVQMSDGLAPVFGSASASNAANDFVLVAGGAAGSPPSYEVTPLGNGFYRVTGQIPIGTITANNTGVLKFASNSSRTFKVTAYDLRHPNTGVNLPPYQRVNTATDYDTAGFPHYLRFDGVDDFLQTNAINFTGTDKMTVFAGARKLSDAGSAAIAELSANFATNSGSFALWGPLTASPNFGFVSNGTTNTSAIASAAQPTTNVITGIGNISGDQAILRINGTQAASSTADQGSGTYGNHPLYIGRRAGTSLPFNGHLYQLIVRGAQSSLPQVQAGEKWTNNRTGAY